MTKRAENKNADLSFYARLKKLLIGDALDIHDPGVFHSISLIAFFAWVGLGADGLSSSCYGPEEAFRTLGAHKFLSIGVALASAFTVFIIATSYSQIIELFPQGGGGYFVASKLLSPGWGMVSGCALLIDYVLTITVSIASGADAIFSFLPSGWHYYKIEFAVFILILLTFLNLRGVKESVMALLPIFITFVITHLFIIIYALAANVSNFGAIAASTVNDINSAKTELGFGGMIWLMLKAYTMGAGTYTGIEAVSNGIPVLREPKVKTAKITMRYMAFSLAFTVVGILFAYLLYDVSPVNGKTLNAVLLEKIVASWPLKIGYAFLLVTLISEAMLLFVGAQAGFLDGPRVLANMAIDRWFPTKFAILSDRLVTQNGILIMSGLSLFLMIYTKCQVSFLIVLYSINVFVTFLLSQLGMVKHWWEVRNSEPAWKKKLIINGIGLVLTFVILVSVTIIKFHEGGWLTLLITGSLIALAYYIKRHYNHTSKMIGQLSRLLSAADHDLASFDQKYPQGININDKFDKNARTAVLLVGGYNGMGLHALFNIVKLFGDSFKNYVFLRVGILDAGNFKGTSELEKLTQYAKSEVDKYVKVMKNKGYHAEGISVIGTDVVEETIKAAPIVAEKYPNSIFFGGQLIFPEDTYLTKMLHNYTAFIIQRKFYYLGIPIVIMPIRLMEQIDREIPVNAAQSK